MKYRIAIGTNDKINVTEHFGQSRQFDIFEIDQENDEITYVEERTCTFSTQCGEHQDDKLREKIQAIKDCQIVLVKQIGGQSEKVLNHNNIIALQYQGTIEGALMKIIKFYKKYIFSGKERNYGRDNYQQEESENQL
jgi:predicted Fe-Mo cluster-binding NifX family protein